MYHKPVLLTEAVNGLDIKPKGIYVDVTFGGGGHAKEILNRLDADGKLVAFDQDINAQQNNIDDNRFLLIPQNFRYVKRFLRFYGIKQIDGLLADFGVSSHQFDVADRGFSTRMDAALDMRMDQKQNFSALQLINTYELTQLKKMFSLYGELKKSYAIANTIVKQREEKPINTINELKQTLEKHLLKGKENKMLAQIFQAIRIEVNQEMEALKELLLQLPDILKKGARISCISYHSLEDRLVKRFIRSGKFDGQPKKDFYGNILVPLKKIGKLVVPSEQEIKNNNRARSAKLRIAEKI